MSRRRSQQTLERLRAAARDCRSCDLWRPATQTVFGEGPADSRRMIVGEQAGDQEDRQGHPFVGPSGRLLEKTLAEVGLERDALYVTNVVKHFKFELRGKRRLHQRANAAEINACMQWLDGEMEAIRPRYVLCLGALAAKMVIGSDFRLTRQRGTWIRIGADQWALATTHPAYVLRLSGSPNGESSRADFLSDLTRFAGTPEEGD